MRTHRGAATETKKVFPSTTKGRNGTTKSFIIQQPSPRLTSPTPKAHHHSPKREIRTPTAEKQNTSIISGTVEMPYTDAYASSKEKVLISKIIALKQEKNELNLAYKKREDEYKGVIVKTKTENQALKAVLKQIIPAIKNSMDPKLKTIIQGVLEKANVFVGSRVCRRPLV